MQKYSGEISEWNEGNFKSMRMDKAQQLINEMTVDPTGRSVGKWHYDLWVKGIVILFKEGAQKYSDTEYGEVNKLKTLIEYLLDRYPPCRLINSKNGRRTQQIIAVNKVWWNIVKEKIEEFEHKVKFYNDKHGLSTRNKGTSGLF